MAASFTVPDHPESSDQRHVTNRSTQVASPLITTVSQLRERFAGCHIRHPLGCAKAHR